MSDAIDLLKEDPFLGTKIPHRLWPKFYAKKFSLKNLYKLNLSNAWRLIYTVKADELVVVSVILDWFNHKDYEKKFNYKKK